LMLVPPQLDMLLPQAKVPASPAANAATDARRRSFFIFLSPYLLGKTQTPFTCSVPGPQEIGGGLLLLSLMFVPPQELMDPPQPIEQPSAAAKAIADTRKIFIRPPLCSAALGTV
jgi:hypothetical protein